MVEPYFYDGHYRRLDVLYNIFNRLKNREFALLSKNIDNPSTRHIKISNVQGLQFWLINMHAGSSYRKMYNLYSSMATYKDGVAPRSGNLQTPINKDFWDEHYNHMIAYDLLIDIDITKNTTLDLGIISVDTVRKALNKLNVPYYFVFSGKGFHLKIPHRAYSELTDFNPYKKPNIYTVLSKVLKGLNNDYSEMIDTAVCDSRRLCKIPFSLACYGNEYTQCFEFDSVATWEEFKKNPEIMQQPIFWYGKIYKFPQILFNKEGSAKELLNTYT